MSFRMVSPCHDESSLLYRKPFLPGWQRGIIPSKEKTGRQPTKEEKLRKWIDLLFWAGDAAGKQRGESVNKQ
jgi:hypothetical protein